LKLHQAAIAYFIAGSFFFVIGCLTALSVNYIPIIFTKNPDNPFSYPVTYMQFGVILEVLCFTLGMSVKNRQNEKEMILAQAQLIEQLQENEKKQSALRRIRDDISRDLHDELGADLSGISAMSHAALRQFKNQEAVTAHTIKTIGETSRKVVTRMREIIWSLNSTHDSVGNFSFRIKETAYALLEHQPIELNMQLPAEEIDLYIPNDCRRNLFLVYKEILHNVVRHSQAQNVKIDLFVSNDNINLVVKDDGVGFAGETIKNSGNGLLNLRQRTAAFGGKLSIDSYPGRGTTISVLCPIEDNIISV
jgi:signal transduction histidine kinase